MEESLIIEVWDIFKEYINDKNRETAADHYVDFLVSKDVSTSTLESITGYDPALDRAIEFVLEEKMEEEDDSDDWDSYEDDEE